MKNLIKTLILTSLAIIMAVIFVACATVPQTTTTTSNNNGAQQIPEDVNVRVMVFSGTTGFGMAPLMDKNAKGESENEYTFSVESTNVNNVVAALINGSVDIAALPTNAASMAFNKTEGGVQVLALNTKGVLYLVQTGDGEAITSLSQLEGKTVYTPQSNPAFVFQAICEKSGVDVNIDSATYKEPAALRKVVASGEVEFAVLPEPMVTIAQTQAKNAGVSFNVRLDLTNEWNSIESISGELVQGCVVVRKEFADKYPNTVNNFLKEYEESINFLNSNPKEASEMIVSHKIFEGQAPIAEKAIPKCNIFFSSGEEMKTMLAGYLEELFGINKNAVGGALPADNFYYIVK